MSEQPNTWHAKDESASHIQFRGRTTDGSTESGRNVTGIAMAISKTVTGQKKSTSSKKVRKMDGQPLGKASWCGTSSSKGKMTGRSKGASSSKGLASFRLKKTKTKAKLSATSRDHAQLSESKAVLPSYPAPYTSSSFQESVDLRDATSSCHCQNAKLHEASTSGGFLDSNSDSHLRLSLEVGSASYSRPDLLPASYSLGHQSRHAVHTKWSLESLEVDSLALDSGGTESSCAGKSRFFSLSHGSEVDTRPSTSVDPTDLTETLSIREKLAREISRKKSEDSFNGENEAAAEIARIKNYAYSVYAQTGSRAAFGSDVIEIVDYADGCHRPNCLPVILMVQSKLPWRPHRKVGWKKRCPKNVI